MNITRVARKLGFDKKEDINVYIYDSQCVMMTQKYGYIVPILTPFLDMYWYIVDNIRTDVILTSPENLISSHSYEDCKNAVLHEITHAYVSVINPKISLWLTEGVALYLTNGRPFFKSFISKINIPSYKDTCSKNPVKFGSMGGYNYAHTYIEYIDKTYGWEKVLELLKTENYEHCFNKAKYEIYNEWVSFISDYYQ